MDPVTPTAAMGIDIGSLTAKGVLLVDGLVATTTLRRAAAAPRLSIEAVADALCLQASIARSQVAASCLTGYGRFEAPFAAQEKSEISCHALGAWSMTPSIRTVIDIGGQDSKVMAVDAAGRVQDFAMNDKCAAGTGRALEVLAGALGVAVEELGPLAIQGRPGHRISNRCSLYMEVDVLQLRRQKVATASIARAIVDGVVERVLALAAKIAMEPALALTGGVAKNAGVAAALERHLGQALCRLPFDPQLIGALGAARFAERSLRGD